MHTDVRKMFKTTYKMKLASKNEAAFVNSGGDNNYSHLIVKTCVISVTNYV